VTGVCGLDRVDAERPDRRDAQRIEIRATGQPYLPPRRT
jgi:hypothetical protein